MKICGEVPELYADRQIDGQADRSKLMGRLLKLFTVNPPKMENCFFALQEYYILKLFRLGYYRLCSRRYP
jgi:hypothetical protein